MNYRQDDLVIVTQHVAEFYFLLSARRAVATDCIVFVRLFFSVRTITHKPLHLAWWYFARTCTLTRARTLLNLKVKGQGHFSLVDQSSPNCFHRTWKKS